MSKRRLEGVRRGAALICAFAVVLSIVSVQGASAKTTKKKAATTKKKAATQNRTATTARPSANPADQGPARNIVGTAVPPGAPIKVGIVNLAANEFNGNVQRMYQIAFDALEKKGEIPIHGREIVTYFKGIDALNDAANAVANTRAACVALAQDDKVFTGLGNATECLATDYKIPSLISQLSDEAMARSFPYAFAVQESSSAALRNLPYWADDLGLLKGQKLGMYHGIQAGRQQAIDDHFKPSLKKLGYSLAEDLGGADQAADRVAVQRFKAAGVTTIFLTITRPGDFGKAARAQGYKPKWIFGADEGSMICDGCPARLGMEGGIFGGTYAMTARRGGENGLEGNPQPNPPGVECAETYEKFSGERVRQQGTALEAQRWQMVQHTCMHVNTLVAALKAAGPNLTQGALINAYETGIKGVASGFWPDVSFSRSSHFGTNQNRTLQLNGDCLCWKVRSPFRPNFVA